jgi:hypothetical protein
MLGAILIRISSFALSIRLSLNYCWQTFIYLFIFNLKYFIVTSFFLVINSNGTKIKATSHKTGLIYARPAAKIAIAGSASI